MWGRLGLTLNKLKSPVGRQEKTNWVTLSLIVFELFYLEMSMEYDV